jgi:hypothetical protein
MIEPGSYQYLFQKHVRITTTNEDKIGISKKGKNV